jgi:hypothetical protein
MLRSAGSNFTRTLAAQLGISPPSTINDFARLWKSVEGRTEIYAVSAVFADATVALREHNGATTRQEVKVSYSDTGESPIPLSLSLVMPVSGVSTVQGTFEGHGSIEVGATFQEVTIDIPVQLSYVPVQLQESIARSAQKPWSVGPFELAFPELSRLSDTHRALKLSTVTDILDSERIRSGEQFEVLGAKLPGNVITKVGIFVLAILQLYFVMHLRRLEALLYDYGRFLPRVAWIGLYPDRLARFVVSASAFVAPLTSYYILWLHFEEYLAWRPLLYVLVAVAGATSLGAVAAVRALTFIRSQLWTST